VIKYFCDRCDREHPRLYEITVTEHPSTSYSVGSLCHSCRDHLIELLRVWVKA
jgi:hypothetical protein